MIPSAETKFHSAANFWEMLGVCQKRLHMFCRPRESIRPDSSWKALGVLREYGVDGRLLLAVKSLYSCSEVCVHVRKVKSRPFTVGVGLRQGCVLSPLHFIVSTQWRNRRVVRGARLPPGKPNVKNGPPLRDFTNYRMLKLCWTQPSATTGWLY